MEALEVKYPEGEIVGDFTQLAIPEIDDRRADTIAVSFGGSVDLEPADEDDLAFINGLKMFDTVQVTVTATVVRKGFSGTPGDGTKADKTGFGVGLKVQSLDVA